LEITFFLPNASCCNKEICTPNGKVELKSKNTPK
jgi:hypothetical protein